MTGLTLILLPGMDGSGQLFAPFIAALGDGFNVKVVRYPVDLPLGYDGLEQIARAAIPPEGAVVLLGESFSGPIAVSLAASLVGVTPEALRARMRAVLAVDVSAKLSQLRAPVLYLRAKRDWVMPRAAGELIVKLAPHTQVAEFDAPHFLLQTVPTETARIVAEFCSQIQCLQSDEAELR